MLSLKHVIRIYHVISIYFIIYFISCMVVIMKPYAILVFSQAVDQLLGVPSESTSRPQGASSLGLSLSLREEQMSEVRRGGVTMYLE